MVIIAAPGVHIYFNSFSHMNESLVDVVRVPSSVKGKGDASSSNGRLPGIREVCACRGAEDGDYSPAGSGFFRSQMLLRTWFAGDGSLAWALPPNAMERRNVQLMR